MTTPAAGGAGTRAARDSAFRLGDSGTLAQLYQNLISDSASNAWPKFLTAVQSLPGGVTSDDPFGSAP